MPDRIRPETEGQLAEVLRSANGPLWISGGGTRLGPPADGAALLETSGLRGIVHYEPGALSLVVRAGTPLHEVNALLDNEGQRLPFEPPDLGKLLGQDGQSTIGGVVASNASGSARIRTGACRDSLIGVRFVDGTGRIIKNGGRVMKNVTGYDLVKLLAGSFGTLGVLSEVSFKVLPKPETSVTLRLQGLDDGAAISAMATALGTPFEVTGAACWPNKGTFLRLEGFAASVAYRADRLSGALRQFGLADLMEEASSVPLWKGLCDVEPFQQRSGDVWKVSIQAAKARSIVERMQADAVIYDWGGGLVWALVSEGCDVRERIGEFSGHATLVRAAAATLSGISRFQPQPGELTAISDSIRTAFDPRGILNPGLMA